jgi:hypothetical protein
MRAVPVRINTYKRTLAVRRSFSSPDRIKCDPDVSGGIFEEKGGIKPEIL